jgi:tubulin polyglutamylase TTLL4
MESIWELFSSVPLPYSYVEFPDLSSPDTPKDNSLFYYVNRVITSLSRRAFVHGGIEESSSIQKWNFSWGRQFEAEGYARCKSWQKINHFAGAFLMGRKDDFHHRMRELSDRMGRVPFYPESYLLPRESEEFATEFPKHEFWIMKPCASARGSGIKILSGNGRLPKASGIYQVYVERPFLITGRKFDLRLYVLVTSISPLRIYMHSNGMARFAVHKYSSHVSVGDLKANLTNYSLNKDDDGFVAAKGGVEKVNNSKWSLEFFMEYLKKSGVDTEGLLRDIEKVTISTVIAGVCAIRKHHRTYITHRHTSYELYGIDILLDENLKPFVMEINISPGMDGSDSPLDKRLKRPLMHETLKMARFIRCDCRKAAPCPGIDLMDARWKSSMSESRQNAVMTGEDPWKSPVFGDLVHIRDFLEEKHIETGFRRVYPKRKTLAEFAKCFDVVEYSDLVFHGWIAKSEAERLALIEKGFSGYKAIMEDIHRQLGREGSEPSHETAAPVEEKAA